MAAQRILVTGGAGFIGSHLSRRLIDLGHEVLVVDGALATPAIGGEPLRDILLLDWCAELLAQIMPAQGRSVRSN